MSKRESSKAAKHQGGGLQSTLATFVALMGVGALLSAFYLQHTLSEQMLKSGQSETTQDAPASGADNKRLASEVKQLSREVASLRNQMGSVIGTEIIGVEDLPPVRGLEGIFGPDGSPSLTSLQRELRAMRQEQASRAQQYYPEAPLGAARRAADALRNAIALKRSGGASDDELAEAEAHLRELEAFIASLRAARLSELESDPILPGDE